LTAVLERLQPSSALTEWQEAAARNNAMYWDWGAAHMNGRILRRADVQAADPGSPSPFPNSATLLEPLHPDRAADMVSELRAFYGAIQAGPFLLWSAWETPDLTPHGLVAVGHPPLMIRWPWEATALSASAELTVVEATDAQTARDWLVVVIAGYPVPELTDPGARVFVDERVFGGPYRLWVGYIDGRPVTCSAAFMDGTVNGVFAVATVPEFRGHGYGAVMTDIAATADPTLPALLTASDLGFSVYARIGFRAIGRFTLWLGHR
jgi:GNAT superfamily N-acetyltransferase